MSWKVGFGMFRFFASSGVCGGFYVEPVEKTGGVVNGSTFFTVRARLSSIAQCGGLLPVQADTFPDKQQEEALPTSLSSMLHIHLLQAFSFSF